MEYDLIDSKYLHSLSHYLGQKKQSSASTVDMMKYIVGSPLIM